MVHSDAEARRIVERHRRRGETPPPLGLLGGDLCRTLGGRGDRARLFSPRAREVPVDLGAVLVDGVMHWFVAHLLARRTWWFGRIIAVMNAQFMGKWNVAPRSHPNDGRLDILDVELTLTDRLEARRRLPRGAHVPHPAIRERQVDTAQFELQNPMPIWLDGERIDAARQLAVRVEPDALTCVV